MNAAASRGVEQESRVLVVDDVPQMLNAIRRVLNKAGFRILCAGSAAEAREVLEREEVQVVLSDVDMPHESGIQFLAWLRETHPRMQRILFTGLGREVELERAINEARVHRFLRKPFSNAELVETIRQSFEQWKILNDRDRLLQETMEQQKTLLELNETLEQKVAERSARAERATAEWRQLFDSIHDPLLVVDERFRIRRANIAAAATAQNEIKNLITRRCHEALFGRSEACEGCPLAAEDSDESTAEISDGSGRLWEMNTWPFRDEEVGFGERLSVCHYRDVTQARELQRQVVLLEKLAAIGDLAGRVAHELNNPLTGILTFSQIIQRNQNVEMASGLASDIEDAARRCSNIVQSLLDFARGGGGSHEVTEIDLVEVIENCVYLARLQTDEETLRFELDLDDDLPRMRGQVDAVKSLFLNLITNAVQAMEGRGCVSVRATRLADEDVIQVQVRDQGPGVPEELRERIFEPFFTTKAENRQGTGLGLAIVSNAVRDHDGRIDVHNEADGGACFTVELPVQNNGEPT